MTIEWRDASAAIAILIGLLVAVKMIRDARKQWSRETSLGRVRAKWLRKEAEKYRKYAMTARLAKDKWGFEKMAADADREAALLEKSL